MSYNMWERNDGDDLRRAIARRASNAARQQLKDMGQRVPRRAPDPELRKPTQRELVTLTSPDDEGPWREGVDSILKAFGESYRRMIAQQRDAHIVECRAAIAAYLRNRGWSYPRIGRFMKRDHSSIVHLLEPEKRQQRYIKVRELSKSALEAMDKMNA